MAYVKEEWWYTYTDADGTEKRIGWLWPEDMRMILESFYGKKWVLPFCADFGFHRSTVDRWKDGKSPIPKHAAQIVSMLGTLKVRGLPLAPITPNHPAQCECSLCKSEPDDSSSD